MPRLVSILAAATVAAGLSAPAANAADVLNVCAADIGEYCDAVEPGHGRIASCLYAHETVISDACFAATSDVGDFLDSMFAGMKYVLQACGGDIQKFCAETQAGDGRIFSCLNEHKGDLSETCAPMVGEFTAFLAEDEAAQ